MNYEYRCLICDHIWESDILGEDCPKCGEHHDIFIDEPNEACENCSHSNIASVCQWPFDCPENDRED